MIAGTVDSDGVPTIAVSVAGQNWTAVVDTGFNGDATLPEQLRPLIKMRPHGRYESLLASGEIIEEDVFLSEFEFDSQVYGAEITFAPIDEIIIGTHLLRNHQLDINFVLRSVLLEKV